MMEMWSGDKVNGIGWPSRGGETSRLESNWRRRFMEEKKPKVKLPTGLNENRRGRLPLRPDGGAALRVTHILLLGSDAFLRRDLKQHSPSA